jgi:putative DNA modification/repair radical SAM protein
VDLKRKLTVLADAAKYDASCASSGSRRKALPGGLGNTTGMGICHSYTPDGRCVSLLKILLTNYCVFDCQYCVNRSSSEVERARFTPEEVVQLTLDFYRRNYIEGLFLSSGVLKNPDYTMEQLVRVARLLREEHAFGGYIHLKAAPGVARELLNQAGRYADRVSVNVELPTRGDLARLAPEKNLPAIESVMSGLRDGIRAHEDSGAKERFLPAGQSTQMIVGATETQDGQILSVASNLYRSFGLRRVYYSAFSPIPHADPRLPAVAPPLLREHRLYEADWLIRSYGFTSDELVAPEQNLRLDIDPKLAWALSHRDLFPIDIQRAERELLLRVPGLGLRNVERVIVLRRERPVRLDDLRRLRANVRRAAPFLITADKASSGRRDLDEEQLLRSLKRPEQLELFAPPLSTSGGDV